MEEVIKGVGFGIYKDFEDTVNRVSRYEMMRKRRVPIDPTMFCSEQPEGQSCCQLRWSRLRVEEGSEV